MVILLCGINAIWRSVFAYEYEHEYTEWHGLNESDTKVWLQLRPYTDMYLGATTEWVLA